MFATPATGNDERMSPADLHFYFDPICPFAWMTSKWVRAVCRQRDYTVDWRFIALRMVNANVDYASQFPEDYEAGHTAGLRLLRVAAATRAAHGRDAVGPLYESFGQHIFERPEGQAPGGADRGSRELAVAALRQAGLPERLADALDEEHYDAEIHQETDEALSLTGKDVGTPILHFDPPNGTALFGPVISRMPDDTAAVELWEHVLALSRFPGFAELKRSLRERPQLPAFGVSTDDDAGRQEDWHGGSRRLKK